MNDNDLESKAELLARANRITEKCSWRELTELMIETIKNRERKEQPRRQQVTEILLEGARHRADAEMIALLEEVLVDVEHVLANTGSRH
jgi:hypothetical protein